jgi:hypothetical protein
MGRWRGSITLRATSSKPAVRNAIAAARPRPLEQPVIRTGPRAGRLIRILKILPPIDITLQGLVRAAGNLSRRTIADGILPLLISETMNSSNPACSFRTFPIFRDFRYS